MKRIAIIHRTLDPTKFSEYRTNWLTIQAMSPLLKDCEVFLFIPELDNLSARLKNEFSSNFEIVGIPYPYNDWRLHHALTKRWVHRKWQSSVRNWIFKKFGSKYFDSVLVGSSLNWDNYVDFSDLTENTIVGPIDGARKINVPKFLLKEDKLNYLIWKTIDFLNRNAFNFSNVFSKVVTGASVIIVSSTEMKKLLSKRSRKLLKIPDTVLGKISISQDLKIKSLDKRRTRILWVGSISFRKNVALLFKIAKMLEDREIDFVICGESAGRASFKFNSMLNEHKNIIYKGSLSADCLKSEYKKSDFVIFTSIRDGYTNVYMEAFEQLTPSVVTSGMSSYEFNYEYLPDLVYKVDEFDKIVLYFENLSNLKIKDYKEWCKLYKKYLEAMFNNFYILSVDNRAKILIRELLDV
jgi:glycosyltransferase involved in cell wall biosynthesis